MASPPPRFIPLGPTGGQAPDTGGGGAAASSYLGSAGTLAKLAGGLSGNATLGTAGSALGGLSGLVGGIANRDPWSSLLSAGQLGSTISGWLGGPTIGSLASSAASSLGLPALPSLSAGAAAPLAFPAMMMMGGLAGMGEDAQQEALQKSLQSSRLGGALGAARGVSALGNNPDAMAANVPGSLGMTARALRGLDHLDYAGPGYLDQPNLFSQVPQLRADVGRAHLATRDLAADQGIDTAPYDESGWGPKWGSDVTFNSEDAVDQNPVILSHLLGVPEGETDPFRTPPGLDPDKNPMGTWGPAQMAGRLYEMGLTDTPEELEELKRRGFTVEEHTGPTGWLADGVPAPAAPIIGVDKDKIRGFLNDEYSTLNLRNAVVDNGGAHPGLGGDAPWRGPGNTTIDYPIAQDLAPLDSSFFPSVGEFDAARANLDTAGFEPGGYMDALNSFLASPPDLPEIPALRPMSRPMNYSPYENFG